MSEILFFNFVTRKQIIKISYNNQQLRFNHFYRSRGKLNVLASRSTYDIVQFTNDVYRQVYIL